MNVSVCTYTHLSKHVYINTHIHVCLTCGARLFDYIKLFISFVKTVIISWFCVAN